MESKKIKTSRLKFSNFLNTKFTVVFLVLHRTSGAYRSLGTCLPAGRFDAVSGDDAIKKRKFDENEKSIAKRSYPLPMIGSDMLLK